MGQESERWRGTEADKQEAYSILRPRLSVFGMSGGKP